MLGMLAVVLQSPNWLAPCLSRPRATPRPHTRTLTEGLRKIRSGGLGNGFSFPDWCCHRKHILVSTYKAVVGLSFGTCVSMENAEHHSPPPPQSYKLLLKCPIGLSPSQVSVDFSASYDRIPHPDTDLDNTIAEIWNRRIRENPSLYDGKKFRYGGLVLYKHGDLNQVSHVCLQLGLTDYRTFVGTNLNPLWEKFLVPSEDDSIRCQHTSSPLGNGAVVETADKKIIVLQRSNNVGEFPGHFVFPGGHPEPHEIGILAHQQEKDSTDFRHINQRVSQEMFDSIIREVVEEIGAPAPSLSNPVFIGISRRELNVRPTAFFSIRCNLESQEIQQLYCNAQDGYESTQLYFVSMSELANMTSKMPGCHAGGFALYTLMVEALMGI